MNKILAMAVAAVVVGAGLGVGIGAAEEAASGPATAAGGAAGAGTQGAGTQGAASQGAMPKELAGRMDEWIGLLKAGKNKELMESMVSPEVLADLKKVGEDKYAKEVEDFGQDKAARLLKELEKVRTQTPTMGEDGKTADFGRGMRFKVVEGKWYFDGH